MNLKKAFQAMAVLKNIDNQINYGIIQPCYFYLSLVEERKSQINDYLPPNTTSFTDKVTNNSDQKYGRYELSKVIDIWNFVSNMSNLLTTKIELCKHFNTFDVLIGEEKKTFTYDSAVKFNRNLRNFINHLKMLNKDPMIIKQTAEVEVAYNTGTGSTSSIKAQYDVIMKNCVIKEEDSNLAKTTIDKYAKIAEELSDAIEKCSIVANLDPGPYDKITQNWTFDYLYDNYDMLKELAEE